MKSSMAILCHPLLSIEFGSHNCKICQPPYTNHMQVEHSSSIVRSPCVNTNASLTAASIVGSIDPDREPKRARTLDSTRIQDFQEFSRHTIHVLVRLKRNDGLEKRWPVQSRRVKPFSCVGERQVSRRVFLNRGSIHDISLTIFAQIRWQLDVAVAVVVGDRGDGDRFILEVTGSDNPAALIATFNGIVMNGC